ncbi:MAG: Sodium Bile acid symporter family protein [Spirochaetes bacterium ADurb.Bin218]|nr:MAG: Sodium Bile acid symporter family protein [Spirochaetes bacterium ADurb.Bin218]HOQ11054.1 bile acid:sodium symporter family protein [Spirochaetota bacterium]
MNFLTSIIEKFFILWVVIFSLCGFLYPEVFKPLVKHIPLFLGIIMFGMGLTLTIEDFAVVLQKPRPLFAGVAAQFIIMPLVAFVLCKIFNLNPMLAIGVILVGTCPGGTASNVITYLSKGDVALSVAMTTASTLLSPIATPALTYVYAGKWIPVPVLSMFVSILQIIIIPVALGLALKMIFKDRLNVVQKFLPSVSVIAIVTIIAGITAANASNLRAMAVVAFSVVALHNLFGLAFGYLFGFALKFDKKVRRTIAIEVGMQNSGLAVSLAVLHFQSVAAVPGAIFSIWHNISGSILAWWWGRIK